MKHNQYKRTDVILKKWISDVSKPKLLINEFKTVKK